MEKPTSLINSNIDIGKLVLRLSSQYEKIRNDPLYMVVESNLKVADRMKEDDPETANSHVDIYGLVLLINRTSVLSYGNPKTKVTLKSLRNELKNKNPEGITNLLDKVKIIDCYRQDCHDGPEKDNDKIQLALTHLKENIHYRRLGYGRGTFYDGKLVAEVFNQAKEYFADKRKLRSIKPSTRIALPLTA
ncbi:MAG: hypothetical protein ABIG93_04475 [archaeon]|nr:hypothetical protein [Nanoarchaeota archaeon]